MRTSQRSSIPDATLERVREAARLDFENLFMEYAQTPLKRSGSSWKALCPFHDESTPSFSVNLNLGLWHCFGCSLDGDVISFVQAITNESFPETVRHLGGRYNIPIEAVADAEDGVARRRSREALEAAHEFFASALHTPDAAAAQKLLGERGFSPENATRFDCGYAPDGNRLVPHLRKRGFTDEDILTAGLAHQSKEDQRLWDFFRNRLTWTIRDTFGKPIGFGARRLNPDDRNPAKFINTPETPMYVKSRALYGLSYARKSIAATNHVIVVEGYTDVMAMHLAGVTNAVATCGTAFTPNHASTLARLVGEGGEITFALDDDSAGRKATLAVYDATRGKVSRLTVIPPSDGKDPDEYRQAHGEAALAALVDSRRPLVQVVIDSTLDQHPLDGPEDRVAALDAVAPILAHVHDPLIRDEYARSIAKRLSLSLESVLSRTTAPAPPTPPPPSSAPLGHIGTLTPPQQVVAALVQSESIARRRLPDARRVIIDPDMEALCRVLADALDEQGPWASRLADACPDELQPALALVAAAGSPVSEDQIDAYLTDLLKMLDSHSLEAMIAQVMEQLNAATTEDEQNTLLLRLMDLKRRTMT